MRLCCSYSPGRKYGPPPNWTGPVPSISCELFIKEIPRKNFEHELIPHFERFGIIYEFRLMMDYDYSNRGYGYLRYTNEADAQCAIDVMKFYLVENGKTLEVQRSYNKCRLFVGNIPRDKNYEEVHNTLKEMFPEMCNMIFHGYGHQNRGFAFIDFPDHDAALRAKVKSSPGFIRIWGQEIKVVWANPERSSEYDEAFEVRRRFISFC